MIVLEVAGAVVLIGLVVTATWMAIVGLMGITGALRLRRCRECGHLIPSTPQMATGCPYCRHERLARHVIPMRLHHFLPGEW
jgi:hypothetical protein